MLIPATSHTCFKLPKKLPQDYCFGGQEHDAGIKLVNWFNPIDQEKFWGDVGALEYDLEQLEKLHQGIREFVQTHKYFNKENTFMAIIGDVKIVSSFII